MGAITLQEVRDQGLVVGQVRGVDNAEGQWPQASFSFVTVSVRIPLGGSTTAQSGEAWGTARSFLDVDLVQAVAGGDELAAPLRCGDFVAFHVRPAAQPGALELFLEGVVDPTAEPLPEPAVQFPAGVYAFEFDPATVPADGVRKGDPVWYDPERRVAVFGTPPEGSPPRARGTVADPGAPDDARVHVALEEATVPLHSPERHEHESIGRPGRVFPSAMRREVNERLFGQPLIVEREDPRPPAELDPLGRWARKYPAASKFLGGVLERPEPDVRSLSPNARARDGLGSDWGALALLSVLQSLALLRPGSSGRAGNANTRPSSVFPGTHSSGPPPAATGGA